MLRTLRRSPRRPIRKSFLNLVPLESRVVPANFWVDDAWTGFTIGQPITDVDPVQPGDQPGIFGTDAFAKINDALAVALNAGDVVTVNSGTYAEAANLTVAGVTLKFQESDSTVGSLAAATGTLVVLDGITLTAGGNGTSTAVAADVSGSGGLIKIGAGTLTLNGTNTFIGLTQVNEGTLLAGSATALGDAGVGTLVASGATLKFSGAFTSAEPLTISGSGVLDGGAIRRDGTGTTTLSGGITLAADARINTDNGQLTIGTKSVVGTGLESLTTGGGGKLVISSVLSIGSGALNIDGDGGQTQLTGNNGGGVFTGPINITNNGTLSINATTTAGTTGDVTLDNGRILNTNTGNAGTFLTTTRPNVILGPGGGTFEWPSSGAGNLIIVQGGTLISGDGDFKKRGTGIISVVTPATYTGKTIVEEGILRVRTNSNVFPITTELIVNAGATFDVGPNLSQTVGSLTGEGDVNIPGGTFTVGDATSTTFKGLFTSTGKFVKVGSGTLTVEGASTHSGVNKVNDGTLLLANTTGSGLGTGSVTVNAPGILANTDTANIGSVAGAVIVNGTLAPGDIGGVSQLKLGSSLSLNAGSVLDINIKGTTAGAGASGYDQIVTTGAVTINDALLNVDATGTAIPVGSKITIIQNNSAVGVGGTFFFGQAEGSVVTSLDGQTFKISYVGGDGNDIVLTRFAAAKAVRYVDDAWVGLPDGTFITDMDPVEPGDQGGTIGTNAFATIAKAVAASPANDKIVINSGTYNEAVVFNIPLQVTFQEADSSVFSLAGTDANTTIDLAGIVLTTGGDNTSTSLAAEISGTGGIIKVGSGTWTLAAANTYTGATTVADGNLKAAALNAFSSVSAHALTSPSRLILNGFNAAVGNLAGNGIVENAAAGNAKFTVGGNNGDVIFTGTIQDGTGGGSLGFTKIGTGGLFLPDNMSFTGPFTLGGGSYEVAVLANAGVPSPFGASTASAGNFNILGGGTLKYTAAMPASTDRNITWGAGGGTISVLDPGATVTMSGTITGATPGIFVKAGSGTLVFTAADAFQTPNTMSAYGVVSTGNVSVTGGELHFVNFRANGTTRPGGARSLTISSGARAVSTGTLFLDPGNSYLSQVAGLGTLEVANPAASKTNPSIAYDVGPTGGNGSPFGSILAAPIEFTEPSVIVGKANRNNVGRYSGDLRIDSVLSGTESVSFIGLTGLVETGQPDTNKHNMHFVITNENPLFEGDVFLANADLALTKAGALSALNSLTFNSTDNPDTANRAALFLFGHSVTIGSLNDVSDPATTSFIRNGSLDTGFGGTNTSGVTGSKALGLQADSTLTIVQTSPGVFKGQINNGPNDRGANGDSTFAYRTLSITLDGASTDTLTLTGTSKLTGFVSIVGGTLIQDGEFTAAADVTVGPTGELGGSGSITPQTLVIGRIGAGTFGGAGVLELNDLTFFFDGIYEVDLLGPTVGTKYDQISATGIIALSGAKLEVNSKFTPVLGAEFVIINNNSPNPVFGEFQNLPQDEFFFAGGTKYQIKYNGGDGNDVVLIAASGSSAGVSSFTVNNGASQRSRLTSITVDFTGPVDASTLTSLGAITLTRTAATATGVVGTVVQTGVLSGAFGRINVAPTSGMVTSITLTFDNADGSNETSGVEYGSLADGRWQLAIPSLGFTSTLNDPELRRLFGDTEPNGTVDSADFAAFGAAFGTSGPIGFSMFDYDNNGTIDSSDFGAFGSRFGVSI